MGKWEFYRLLGRKTGLAFDEIGQIKMREKKETTSLEGSWALGNSSRGALLDLHLLSSVVRIVGGIIH